MILSDLRILEEIDKGTIKIEPYRRECLGSNSYDVHLGKTLATYRTQNNKVMFGQNLLHNATGITLKTGQTLEIID